MPKPMKASITAWLACSICACGTSESDYRAIFLSVPGVEEVAYFLNYEGHRSAALELTDGRYLHIAEFDEAVGTSTAQIALYQIGDLTVACSTTPERSDVVFGGFNVLEVMRDSPLELQLQNIGDIVSHYAEIYGYIEEFLPVHPTTPKQLDFGAYTHWCSRDSSTKRARN